ncbi:lipopolysaccharide assembly LapA domain-containing protein [Ferrovum sp.]|uniref:LapA family protein n=1 Tax=Ferrovum sp. TaxID=2609467 RepID=UPI002611C7D4|nr:LapA family protein [Ferrovum sp.]
MNTLRWLIRIFLFVLLLGFCLKNTTPVTVNFLFGLQWHAPLIIVLLLAVCGGALLGLLTTTRIWWGLRGELARLRRSGSPTKNIPSPTEPPRD